MFSYSAKNFAEVQGITMKNKEAKVQRADSSQMVKIVRDIQTLNNEAVAAVAGLVNYLNDQKGFVKVQDGT